MALNYVSLLVDWPDGSRGAGRGTVTFAPSVVLTDEAGAVVDQPPVVAALRPDGMTVVRLLATDSPGLRPGGWTWSARFDGPAGAGPLSFALPLAAGPSQRLSDLVSSASGGGRSRTRRAVLAATAAGLGGIAAYAALRTAQDAPGAAVPGGPAAGGCITAAQELPVDQTVITRFGRGSGFVLTGAADSSRIGGRGPDGCGAPVAKVVTKGDGVTYADLTSTQMRFDTTGKYLAVRYRLSSALATQTLELDVANDPQFTRFFRWQFADRAAQLGSGFCYDNEWEQIYLSFADATAYGNPDRSRITALRLRAQDHGTQVTVSWQDVALVSDPGRLFPRGIATICFDDIYETQYTRAMPVLRRYGFRGTVAVIRQVIGMPDGMTLAQLHSLQDLGWEIGCHADSRAVHHATDLGVPLAVVSSDLRAELSFLRANGFAGDKILAYPSGRWSPRVIDMVSGHCVAGRLDFFRTQETFPPANPYKLRACGSISSIAGTHTAADVTGYIDAAAANRSWLILIFHKIVTGAPVQRTECSLADFQAIIAHLAASRMPVLTTGEVIEQARKGPGGAGIA